MLGLCIRVIMFVCLVSVARCELTDAQRDMLLVALTDVKQETINGHVVLESGSIPTWLEGNFIRHACSVFGETAHMSESPLNYIQHLFDCIPMATKFRLENGQATFTNRRYDTNDEDCFNAYGRDMNESSVFVQFSTFSQRNISQLKKCEKSNVSNKIPDITHVSWWKVGNEAIAMTETPKGVIVDPESAVQKGYFHYNDDNMGYGSDVIFQNNPAHEQTEPDGTLWSTFVAFQFVPNTPTIKQWRVVYKVDADKVRHVVGELHYPDVDMRKCSRTPPFNIYPEPETRFGYMHSFAATQNYIVLPETAYMFDPCSYAHYDQYEPYFTQGYRYEPQQTSRVLVMNKLTGNFIAKVPVRPFFVTHQLGAYEDGELIHMDMLMYNDSSVYTKTSSVKGLLSENVYTTDVMRITINMTDHSAKLTNLRPGTHPTAIEFSNINYAYYGKKYMYAYMIKNWDRVTDNNTITKLNVDTGKEIEYTFPIGMFPQEPQFVPRPSPTSEDDGVLLTQGIDAQKRKVWLLMFNAPYTSFLAVIDARDMSLVSHVTAPDYSTFGIHNRFYGLEVGQDTTTDIGGLIGVGVIGKK